MMIELFIIYCIGVPGIGIGQYTGDYPPGNFWHRIAALNAAIIWPIYLFVKLAHILEDI